MINLDIDLLRTLVAVEQHGTYAAAAEAVLRTQSAVTQQMQRLEQMLGMPLFEQRGRGKTFTRQGEMLARYARQILVINDEAVRAMTGKQLEGTVRIGSPLDVADSLLPTILTHVARSLPSIKMEIRVDRSPFLMDALHAGDIDLTVSTRFDQTLEGMVVRRTPTVWLCSADYVHDPEQPVPLVLADEPSIFRRVALNALEQSRVAWRANYVAPNLVGIKAGLRAGLGITARGVDFLNPEFRVLGETDGLPKLPDMTYFLWTRPGALVPLTRHVYDLLTRSMGLTEPGRRT
ncbi:LysR family transcriptional regulator [Bradyrhizobium macuxiense]|uniref:LysR family transcriptional regulator n=1 Tax=Bradyrhizobium macuxiense TaxID=1755647 RepID=A0A120FPW8_9BRAD|nr:LysR substrate-binding domain-containing protein [Bradyrhizobium macuxiense]KWV57634.1 LysR family transcriptional regulator [Bradyrhizobium macuxiense]